MQRKLYLFLPVFFAAVVLSAAPDKVPKTDTLIIPGESIGGIKLGDSAQSEKELKKLGDPDGGDSAMGGKATEEWFLGEKRGEKGRQFHRPGEIGVNTLRDMENDSAAHQGKEAITNIYVTSQRFATAEGIAPGSTLDAIRAKFPEIEPDDASGVQEATLWPMYGEVQFYIEKKQGIVFAIRKSNGECVQIAVIPKGTGATYHYPPMASNDYVIDDIYGTVGDINGTAGNIKLGMTGAKLVSLLGKPDEKHDASGGEMWRWRVPAQGKFELPALCIYLRKLPDGGLGAEQIRLSSPAFALTDKIFPGCPLK